MLKVIKIGGDILDSPSHLSQFIDQLKQIEDPYIIVHGGGKLATSLANKLGIESKFIDGRRITSKELLDIAVMSYAGFANKILVANMQGVGISCCGLSGCDVNTVESKQRVDSAVDWGFVGNVINVNTDFINLLLSKGIVPVLSPITFDPIIGLLNSNGDGVAAAVAHAMKAELLFITAVGGVYKGELHEENLIDQLNEKDFIRHKKEGIIQGGMIAKVEYGIAALKQGISSVCISGVSDFSKGTQLMMM